MELLSDITKEEIERTKKVISAIESDLETTDDKGLKLALFNEKLWLDWLEKGLIKFE